MSRDVGKVTERLENEPLFDTHTGWCNLLEERPLLVCSTDVHVTNLVSAAGRFGTLWSPPSIWRDRVDKTWHGNWTEQDPCLSLVLLQLWLDPASGAVACGPHSAVQSSLFPRDSTDGRHAPASTCLCDDSVTKHKLQYYSCSHYNCHNIKP